MTDTEFLHLLDKAFMRIQEDDIRGEDLFPHVYEMYKLCKKYIYFRIELAKRTKDINPLNGVD